MHCISCALVWRGLEEGEEHCKNVRLLEKTYFLVMAKECMLPGLKVQRPRGMHTARIEGPVAGYALYLMSFGIQKVENRMNDWGDIPFGDCEGMHIARIEGPAAGYVLYLLGPGMEGTGEGGGEWQKGQIIGEAIPFGDGEGMHIARIEGPAAGYALYLLCPGLEGTGGGRGALQKFKNVRLLEKTYGTFW
jgi:hypothetical protein